MTRALAACAIAWPGMAAAQPALSREDVSSPALIARDRALAVTRPAVSSIWEPLSWPMRHVEIDGLARRLQLAPEQVIAIDRLHAAYLEQACAQRAQAISAMVAADLGVMSQVKPALADVKKFTAMRRAWLVSLAALDDTLFADMASVLGESQTQRLERERLRRERARFATDAWVAQWWARGWHPYGYQVRERPPIYEIADIIEQMPLTAAEREPIDAALIDCEAQLTRQIKAVFTAACDAREAVADITERLHGPEYNQQQQRLIDSIAVAAMRLVMMEAACADRVASLLPEASREAFGDLYLRCVYADVIESLRGFDHNFAAALARDDLTADERARLDAARADMAKRAAADLPAKVLRARLIDMQLVETARGAHSVDAADLPDDLGRVLSEAAAIDLTTTLNRESFDLVHEMLKGERFRDVNRIVNEQVAHERDMRRDPAFTARSNFVMSEGGFVAGSTLPRAAGSGDVQVVLDRLDLDEGSAAVIRTLNDERAEAWNAVLKQAQRDVQVAMSSINGVASIEGTQAAYARHRRALDEFAANEADFAESLQASLKGLADDAVMMLTLCRQWTGIVSIPPSFPRPVDMPSSGIRWGVAQHVDRAHPVHVLLRLDVPLDRLRPAFGVLTERTPAALAAAAAYRQAVLGAIEAGDLLTIESQLNNYDWTKVKPARQRQSQAALDARARRVALLTELASLHEAVAESLDDEVAMLYRRAIQRIAYPTAVQGIDAALATLGQALSLDDLTLEQRSRIATIAADAQAALLGDADQIALLIDAFIAADGYTPDTHTAAAGVYARMEQAIFVKDERCAAVAGQLRPILTQSQMRIIEPSNTTFR